LCISFYDFVDIGDPYVYPSEGAAHQLVKFRLIVFRPFVGEIIVGKITSSNKDGIKVSVDFFDDILIPASLLQNPSVFNSEEGLWIWKYEENDLTLDIGEEVYFTVSHYFFLPYILL
jgi:DNA-directed RNA polymerase III subunit RPC8